MRNGASSELFNYNGEGHTFEELMDLYEAQIFEELEPILPGPGEQLDREDIKINLALAKSARDMKAAALVARVIYTRHEGDEEVAAAEMLAYTGNDLVNKIGEALQNNCWADLAI